MYNSDRWHAEDKWDEAESKAGIGARALAGQRRGHIWAGEVGIENCQGGNLR